MRMTKNLLWWHVVERSLRRRIKYYSTKEGRTAVFGKGGHGLMSKDLNWAVLGTGVIANEMAALAKSKGLILAEAMTTWHMPLYKEL